MTGTFSGTGGSSGTLKSLWCELPEIFPEETTEWRSNKFDCYLRLESYKIVLEFVQIVLTNTKLWPPKTLVNFNWLKGLQLRGKHNRILKFSGRLFAIGLCGFVSSQAENYLIRVWEFLRVISRLILRFRRREFYFHFRGIIYIL